MKTKITIEKYNNTYELRGEHLIRLRKVVNYYRNVDYKEFERLKNEKKVIEYTQISPDKLRIFTERVFSEKEIKMTKKEDGEYIFVFNVNNTKVRENALEFIYTMYHGKSNYDKYVLKDESGSPYDINNIMGYRFNSIRRRPVKRSTVQEEDALFRDIDECINFTFDHDIDIKVMKDNLSKKYPYITKKYEYIPDHSNEKEYSIQYERVIYLKSMDGQIERFFDTVKEVQEFTNVSLTNIYACLKSKNNITGYKWFIKYVDAKPNFNNHEELSKALKLKEDYRMIGVNKKNETITSFSGVKELYSNTKIKVVFSQEKKKKGILFENDEWVIMRYSYYKSKCKTKYKDYRTNISMID